MSRAIFVDIYMQVLNDRKPDYSASYPNFNLAKLDKRTRFFTRSVQFIVQSMVEAYVSNPITSNPITPETPYSAKYGGDFTDYREPWADYQKYSAGACPIKF